jgi:hypothetical protein
LSQCVLDVSCSLTKYACDDLVHRLKNKLDERARGIGCRRPLLKSSRRGIKVAVPPQLGSKTLVIHLFRLGNAQVSVKKSMSNRNAAASAESHT